MSARLDIIRVSQGKVLSVIIFFEMENTFIELIASSTLLWVLVVSRAKRIIVKMRIEITVLAL